MKLVDINANTERAFFTCLHPEESETSRTLRLSGIGTLNTKTKDTKPRFFYWMTAES